MAEIPRIKFDQSMTEEPGIEVIPSCWLMGMHFTMSFAKNRTAELWQSFMPRRKEITQSSNTNLISLQVYPHPFWPPNLEMNFVKWAAVVVTGPEDVPEGMDVYHLPGGMYAVFTHIGAAPTAMKTFTYIFEDWLPRSPYVLDNRPHFEVLGEKYCNDHPDSEEEVWIPIAHKHH